jgi:hypothetical protein
MITIQKIEFEQAEGLTEDCVSREFTSWDAVNVHARSAAIKAPTDSSYFKCDVGILWSDGTARGFRLDLNRKHAVGNPVSAELREELNFYSGRVCPSHMTVEERDGFLNHIDGRNPELNPGVRERASKLLDGYDIGSVS